MTLLQGSTSGDETPQPRRRWWQRFLRAGQGSIGVALQLLGALAVLWYVVLLYLHEMFYDRLGLFSENVGLTRTFILFRSVTGLITILLYLALVAGLARTVVLLCHRVLGSVVRRTTRSEGERRVTRAVAVPLLRLFVLLRNHMRAVETVAAVIALLLAARDLQVEVRGRAEEAAAGKVVAPVKFLGAPLVFVSAIPVCVYWVGSGPPPEVLRGARLNLLGDDGSRVYFRTTDPADSATVSVPAAGTIWTFSGSRPARCSS